MLTPEQQAKIQQKEAAMPDALKRDPLTDYSEGYFFVTLNTRGEAPILSTVVGHVGGEGADAPHCQYTALGQAVMDCWAQIPHFNPNIEVIAAEAMPEHFHGLLHITRYDKRHLGRAIGGFMTGCTHAYWDTLGIPWRDMKSSTTSGSTSAHTGAIAQTVGQKGRSDPRYQDRDHTRSYRGPALFVHGYNDTVPITPEQVQIKVAYIRDQAEKRLIRGISHECFRISRQQRTHSWSSAVILQALANDPILGYNASERQKAWANVMSRLLGGDAPCLDHVGNMQLLHRGTLLPLICHRADAHRFEEQKEATLVAARGGAIIVSAFISPRENDIRQQLLVEQLPFVEIIDNGIPDRYKPIGQHFYACAENRLLQFSCWTYQYQRDVKVRREMCLVMNQLARVICQRDERWWYVKTE